MKTPAIIFAFLMTTASLLFAQSNEKPDIGLMPFYKFMGENLLIVDATKGELVSFASVGEPIYTATINEDENVFYMATFNNIYKGDIETGDIIDKYKFNDLDFNDPDPMIKIKCTPLEVTPDGRAVYQVNGEINAENNYTLPQHLYVADINSKTSSLLFDITPDNFYNASLDRINQKITGNYIVVDNSNLLLKFIDLDTKKVVEERQLPDISDNYPKLKNYKTTVKYDPYQNLLSYYSTKEGDIGSKSINVILDTKKDEILIYQEFKGMEMLELPTVAGFNTQNSTYYFAKRVSISKENSMPEVSDYDFTKPGAGDEFQKELKKWQDAATNPDNYKVIIYEGGELKKVIAEIPKTMSVGIHNDIYAFVNRFYEIELLNIQTNETIWKIDTDF